MSIATKTRQTACDDTSEIELKLEIELAAMDAFRANAVLAGTAFKDVEQLSTYFDTPQHDLRKAKISLRVRKIGERHVQTVKVSGSAAAGLFARPEWERDIAGPLPELDAESPIRTLVGADILARIVPAFTVTVTRRQWLIEQDGGTVELVADTGFVAVGERTTAISEIELELKSGPPTAIFSLARLLDRDVALRLGVLTKAERGYRLMEAAILGAEKAERLELASDATVAEAFERIVGACLRHFRLNETLLRREPGPEPLHQARVALRRLRSALSIFKPVVADARFVHLASDLKWLAGTLGTARDLDVMLARLAHPDARLIAAHAEAYADALAALDSKRTRDLMIDIVEWTALGAWRVHPADPGEVQQPAIRFTGDVLESLRRRIKRRGDGLVGLEDDARHRARIAAKKLRYATGFFETLYPGKKAHRRFKAFVKPLEALQEQLGLLNDIATAPALLARFDLDDGERISLEDREKILARAADAYGRLKDAKRFW
ncbi:CHAD domain-containing protein [Sphingomonas sp. R86520]|uniref:CYTH and CHAD domain-containing protein n=1 Tax=Sphingomonas sp. R86520 TaxID=3093859 RepID=UPI0036D27B3F